MDIKRAPKSFDSRTRCSGRRYEYIMPTYVLAPKEHIAALFEEVGFDRFVKYFEVATLSCWLARRDSWQIATMAQYVPKLNLNSGAMYDAVWGHACVFT